MLISLPRCLQLSGANTPGYEVYLYIVHVYNNGIFYEYQYSLRVTYLVLIDNYVFHSIFYQQHLFLVVHLLSTLAT